MEVMQNTYKWYDWSFLRWWHWLYPEGIYHFCNEEEGEEGMNLAVRQADRQLPQLHMRRSGLRQYLIICSGRGCAHRRSAQ